MSVLDTGIKGYTQLDRQAMAKGGGSVIIGIDEVGMGPLAGPVCACALIVGKEPKQGELVVNDSKLLSPKRREELFPKIRDNSIFELGWVTVKEINKLQNLNAAGNLARERALKKLIKTIGWLHPNAIICDFFPIDAGNIPVLAVPKADANSFIVACASIVAKVARDRWMIAQAKKYPEYMWDKNSGYRTPEHHMALKMHGITPIHRTYLVDKYLKDYTIAGSPNGMATVSETVTMEVRTLPQQE